MADGSPVVRPAPPTGTLLLTSLLAGGAALVAGHILLRDRDASDATYLGALGLAAVVGGLAASRTPVRPRRVWALVALGIAASAAADLVYSAYGWWGGGEPDVSLADPLWLSSYVFLGVGLLRLTPGRETARGVDVDVVIDSLVVTVIALLVVWEVALGALVSDTATPLLARAVWAIYPVLDIVLLGLVVRLALLHHRSRSPALVLLGAGIASWLAADLAYLVVTSEALLVWLDVGWMVASLLLAGAIVVRTRERPRPEATATAPRRERLWLIMVPILVPTAIEVRGFLRDEDANPFALGAATLALVALASLRGLRLLRAAERARAEVQAREAHFRALASSSSDAVVVLDGDERIVEASGNLQALVGRDDVLGEAVFTALASVDPVALATYLATARRAPGRVAEHEVEVRHADGEVRVLSTRIVNLVDDPAVCGLVVNLQDVTERRRAQDALARQAFHDAMTGLANHLLLSDRSEQALRRTARTGTEVAVLYLDVDGFKSVNDRLGHAAGNTVLVEVAARLRGAVRSADTVARLGGDEFAVLVEEAHAGAEQAVTTADRILQALSVPIDVDGQLIAVTASIGVATADAAGTPAGVLRDADLAMYRAKAAGKARIVVFDEQMGTEASDLARVESELADALAGGQLELHYQPVLELATSRVAGFEALIRWRHPDLGLLGPDRFIPQSEANGLIVPIGRWVLARACAAAARWQGTGAGPLTMAVNLSAVQLATDEVVADVRAALDASGLDPGLLVLEITETALVADPVATAARLRALRDLGVRVAIDDFGTGYSSLSYLRQLPVDILKIDRSFVDTITSGDELPPIVRGLIDLARTLDLEIIAEGIESPAQHEGLRRQACDLGQGFLFSRPLSEADAEAVLTAQPSAPADA